MRNAKKATPPSASPPITRPSRDDRIASSGMGPEISEPAIQVPATKNPTTKKLVEPDGARNVAASKTDPTTSVTTTVRDRRGLWSMLSVSLAFPSVPLWLCTRPSAGVRAMLCGLER